ncbi:MAG TPA: DNA methyltransferase [Pirellulaceae bacterium]|nr:DNA methyltransferase [Pirellulaceae bacterium]
MPVERKPLFRPDVLREHLSAFVLPASASAFRQKLDDWASLLTSGKADKLNEKELLPDFLTDFFLTLLGYTGPAGGLDRYTFRREKLVEVDGKVADAVLGEFNGTPRPVIALEGKGSKDPIDRPYAGRKMSAVDQGYRYAINLPCDWILVTSMRQSRLYFKGADQHTYERFDTEALAMDETLLRQFVYLLGAERVVPADGNCHLYGLYAESARVGRELTKKFYVEYADMRQDAFSALARENPEVPRPQILYSTQKLLDRVLFVAFSEDRGLLPVDTIKKAFDHRDPYHPRPVWDNFRALFRSIDRGNAALGIHAYNGGLFAEDPVLDRLQVSDEVCGFFRDLGAYDYRPPSKALHGQAGSLIDVEILGHIFEQSITDLEKLRSELEGLVEPVGPEKHKTRRKQEGAFYTPAFITRYIIEQALGGVLKDKFEALRQKHEKSVKGSAKASLADPEVYELPKLKKPQREALVAFWEAWQDELTGIRLLDPACGSGAFLIEAFDQLHAEYEASNDRLQELRGHRSLFDLDKRILENNLYGVDLNEEAIEICRLSLWIKTAERGKVLTALDHPIRVGNSVVSDPAVHPKALDWRKAFPEVFEQGGFDVVVGNPPYVRQELLSPIKPHLEENFRAFHGMADLYVYFYELGLNVLRPGGLLSFIVTNKWMKAGYGEPLRKLFADGAWVESVVDFGHAKQIFEDADVFPSIIVARKPTEKPRPKSAKLCTIPREQLRIDDLSRQIEEEGEQLPLEQLRAESWQLEPGGVNQLLAKIKARASSLNEFAGVMPLSGIKTGLNEAFLIDSRTKDAMVSSDSNSSEVLRPYLRGQDFCRWNPDWRGLWMIVLKSSENYSWPWSDAAERAEQIFRQQFPAIYDHLEAQKAALTARQDQGRYWWELRSCAYWAQFERPKIMYPEITWRPDWGLDATGTLCNNTAYFVPSNDLWILAVANAPITWWYSWRTAIHGKDEALRFIKEYVQALPIPPPSNSQRSEAERLVNKLIESTQTIQKMTRSLLDWLRIEHDIEKASLKLQSPAELDSDAFVAEVKRIRGKKKPLSAAALASLREEYTRTIEPARALAAESLVLERQLSDLVNEAYGLTPEEVAQMWDTAPPRMPIPRPNLKPK